MSKNQIDSPVLPKISNKIQEINVEGNISTFTVTSEDPTHSVDQNVRRMSIDNKKVTLTELNESDNFVQIDIESSLNETEEKINVIPDHIKSDIFDNFPIIKDGPYTIPKQVQLETYIFQAKCFYKDSTTGTIPCFMLCTELWIVIVPDKNFNESNSLLKSYVCLPVSRLTEITKIYHKANEISWKFCFRSEHHFTIVCNDMATGTNTATIIEGMSKFTSRLKPKLKNLPYLSNEFARYFKKCDIINEQDPNSVNEQNLINYSDFESIDELEYFQETIYSIENSLNKEMYKILSTMAPGFENTNNKNDSIEFPKEFEEYVEARKKKNNDNAKTNNEEINCTLKIISNQEDLCQTYPKMLAVPKELTDDQIKKCYQFREKGRLPALSYIYKQDGKCQASLWRSSQCKTGMTSCRCEDDENFISQIFGITNSTNGIIYDARPYLNANINRVFGKGFHNEGYYNNTKVKFLDIPNIHAVKSAYKSLVDQTYDPSIVTADGCNWRQIMQKITIGAQNIANSLAEGTFVIVNCSDGWDRTPQQTCLSKIILDPFYRTLKGFKILVEIEWVSFGHQFHTRLKNNEYSPIFIQFLDCVRVIYEQNKRCFEFNDLYQAEICNAYFDCRFDLFIRDSLNDFDKKQRGSGLSIWNWLNKLEDFCLNPFYEKEINLSIKKLTVDTHQHLFSIWYDVHNAALGQSLKKSEYDKIIWEKKLQNESIINKIKSYHEYLDKIGLTYDNNFIKV